jgi:protoporphyrinogen oxidase
LDDQIGILNYLQYDYRVGYHDWITNTAAAISSYQGMGVSGASPPSINTYPDVPFNPND